MCWADAPALSSHRVIHPRIHPRDCSLTGFTRALSDRGSTPGGRSTPDAPIRPVSRPRMGETGRPIAALLMP
jgi:hypothetical protein